MEKGTDKENFSAKMKELLSQIFKQNSKRTRFED